MASHNEFVDFALHLAELAASRILPYFRSALEITNKGGAGAFDPVTAADREAEAALRSEIRHVYPDHGLLGEEHGYERGSSPYTWVIDPIDGTRSFMLGQLHWGTLIALNDGSKPIVGLMHQPYTGETFIGDGASARLHRAGKVTELATSKTARLNEVVLCATDPDMFTTDQHRQAFGRVAARARARRYGGDCYTPCLIAAGCAHLVVEASLKPWDIQALIPIVEGAGGVVTDWAGQPASEAREVVIAANRELHQEVIRALAWHT
ncbi:MAG TPA: histidinol-phosphatase [Steroidobacter sp.]